jgi:hypothetical protein
MSDVYWGVAAIGWVIAPFAATGHPTVHLYYEAAMRTLFLLLSIGTAHAD